MGMQFVMMNSKGCGGKLAGPYLGIGLERLRKNTKVGLSG
jgi:hypothetical protein